MGARPGAGGQAPGRASGPDGAAAGPLPVLPSHALLLSAWCAPRRAYGLEVIGTAAGLAYAGSGHRSAAAALGVPDGTVRGWLRRLEANARLLEDRARAELRALQLQVPLRVTGVPLRDALNVLAAAAAGARDRLRLGPEITWPLLGRLGLARALMPARAG